MLLPSSSSRSPASRAHSAGTHHAGTHHAGTHHAGTPCAGTHGASSGSPGPIIGAHASWTPLPSAAHAAWAEWLRRWKWDAWVTATCAGARPTEDMVRGCVETWLRRCADAEGRRRGSAAVRVYAAVAVERGGVLGRAHAHVLVGGLGRHPDTLAALAPLWTWGDGRCAPYDPAQDVRGTPHGAAVYCTKHLDGVWLHGTLRKWRPRTPRRVIAGARD